MSWWSVLDELGWALLFLFGPGLAVGAALGLRRVWLLAVAPAASVAVLGAGAVLLDLVGMPWGRLGALVVTVVAVVCVLGLRRLLGSRWPTDAASPPSTLWTLVGLVVSAPLAALPIKRGMIDPGMPAQTWDTPFHVNAVRWILETGDGSTLHLGAVSSNPQVERFYPAGWHDLVALVVGDSIPAAVNVTAIVVAAVVWPLGLACLVGAVVPTSRLAPVVAMCLGGAFIAFPARIQSVGTLWPNALAFALVPVALALTVRLTGMRRAALPGADPGSRPAVLTGLVAVLGGVTVCHPNGLLAYVVLSAPLWAAAWWRAARGYREASRAVRSVVVGIPVAVVVLAVVLLFSPLVRSVSSYRREHLEGRLDAVLSVVTDSQQGAMLYGNTDRAWWLLGLVVLGILTTFLLRRGRWLTVSLLIVLGMYTLTVAPLPALQWVVGPWYSDPLRIGALCVVVMAPLTALGLVGAGEAVRRALDGRGAGRAAVAAEVVTAVALVAVVVGSGWLRADGRQWMYDLYYADPEGRWGMVTQDELDMIDRLEDELPDDAVVLGSPFTGAPFVYGLTGHDVVFPHISGSWGPDELLLATELDSRSDVDDVCAALERTGVTHLYTDSRPYWPENENQVRYEASLDDPEDKPLRIELVDGAGSEADAAISACR